MSLFAIAGLSVSISCIILAIFILKHAQNQMQHLWGFFNILVALWACGTYLVGISATNSEAILYWKLTYAAANFISVGFYHLIYCFCALKKRKLLFFAYIQSLLSLPAIFSDLFIHETIHIFKSIFYFKATVLFSLWFSIWSIIICSSFYELFKFKNKQSGINRIQASYLFWGMVLGFSGGVSHVIPAYGIQFYPAWQLSICIYAIIMPFAIFKYRLMELTIVIKRSIMYSILITIISIIYLLTVLLLERLTQEILGYQSLIISIVTAFGLGLIFIPLRHRIQRFVDRCFFKGTHEEIALQNIQLRQEIAQSEKYKTLGTLSSGIAHEIKNPLTAIKTFCEYLPQKLDDKEFLQKFSKIVGHEVGRIDTMVHELLDYGKPAPLSLKKTDIHKLIEDTLAVLSSRFLQHNIRVTKNLTIDHRLLTIDQNQIKQALLNIFLNAIDAMPSGGSLTVGTGIKGVKDLRIKGAEDLRDSDASNPQFLNSSNPVFEISIRDTGCGIAPDDLKQVFDPFFSKKDHGTGLGLSIVQGIMESHGGKVKVESQVGIGTCVTLKLPANLQ